MPNPFIKWAGGKRWLLPQLLPLIKERLTPSAVFFDPFLGGGAVPLALDHPRQVLSDINPDLVQAYREVCRDPWRVAVALQRLIHVYNESPAGPGRVYYDMREQWNSPAEATPADRAALFIFLNRTCFNGLYRVNRKGLFNVPWGKRKQLKWVHAAEALAAVHEHLRPRADLLRGDFHMVLGYAAAGDVIYLDPPYLLGSQGFTSYSAFGFGLEDHERLVRMAMELKRRGAHVIASGSDCSLTRQIYREFSSMTPVVAPRSVGAKSREKASELIMIA